MLDIAMTPILPPVDTGGHPGGAGSCEFTQAHTGSSKQLEKSWLMCGIRQAQMP